MEIDRFLGEPVTFWLELRKRLDEHPDSLERRALLNEIIALRGKIAFYEERVRQMNEFAKDDK